MEVLLTLTQEGDRHLRWPAINLALWDSQAKSGANKVSGSPTCQSLLSDGIWCPMRPGDYTSIVAKLSSRNLGENLFVIYFGGPGGKYLQNMTKLVIGFTSNSMHFIEVQYNVSVQPLWSVIFGCAPTPTNMAVRELTIDGPGGERITAMNWRMTVTSLGLNNLTLLEVCITLASGDKNCQCHANEFQLYTNRGRSLLHEHPVVSSTSTVPDHSVQLGHTNTRLKVDHPDRVVTGLVFVAAEGSRSRLQSPLSFQPMGLITRREEAEPVESSELDGNAALYDCP